MRLLASIALFCTLLSLSSAQAISVLEVQPAQAGPGELATALIDGLNGNVCEDIRVFVGHHKAAAASVRCNVDTRGQTVEFVVPDSAAGAQSVAVVGKGETPSTDADTPNIEILPREEYYAVLSSSINTGIDLQEVLIDGLIKSLKPSLFPTTGLDLLSPDQKSILIDQLTNIKLPSLPSPEIPPLPIHGPPNPAPIPPGSQFPEIPTREPPSLVATFVLPAPGLNPGIYISKSIPTTAFSSLTPGYSNKVCGKNIYVLEKALVSTLPIGLIIQYQKYRPNGIVTAPDTMGRPPGVQKVSTQRSVGAYSLDASLDAIALPRNTFPQNQPAVGESRTAIFLLDTLHSNGQDTADSEDPPGHGKWISSLLEKTSGGAYLEIRPVCNGRSCQLHKVIQGLCEAAAKSAGGERVIVSASLSTPYNNLLLHGAVLDALRAGVAVVVAFGNNDNCRNQALRPNDYCNALPADYTNESDIIGGFGSLYSVGAAEQNNKVTHYVQRGQYITSKPPEYPWGSKTRTNPTVSAPSVFQWGGLLYEGTSFATPLVSGALSLWAKKHPECAIGVWPRFPDTFLNIANLLNLPCPD